MIALLKNKLFVFIFLFLMSLSLRLVKLDNLSLFSDELDVGYQAYSLLTTGRDYKGNFLPLYLQSFTESRAPFLIYTTVPSIALFGLNPFAVRLPPVIFGALSISLTYLLVLLVTKKSSMAIITALIVSFTPWHYHYSRTAFEVTLLLSLILLGTIYFYKYLSDYKLVTGFLSLLFFSLTFYTYNTANIFTPILALFLFITNFRLLTKNIKFSRIFAFFSFTLILLTPIIATILSGQSSARFSLISVFNDQSTINAIVEKRTDFTTSSNPDETIFHNKATAWSQKIYHNYISTLSFSNLFSTGDTNPRHTPSSTSPFLPIILPLFLIGVISSFISQTDGEPRFQVDRRSTIFFLFWLLISPLAASLTVDGGLHATRNFLIIIPISYFTAKSIGYILYTVKLRLLLPILFLIFSFQSLQFIHEYFIHYPKSSFQYWNYSYQKLFSNLPSQSRLFLSHTNYNSLLPYLFYNRYPPKILQSSNFSDISIKLAEGLSGFNLNSQITFITSFNTSDTLQKIKQFTQSGDVILLYQKDIPGDMILDNQSYPGFVNLNTTKLPNLTILGQVIKKI